MRFKDSGTGGIRPLIFTLIRVAWAQNGKEDMVVFAFIRGGRKGVQKPQNRTEMRQKTANRI